eukprot:CAMPEP_0185733250 /NCGR_PEP_ID=MMETSP1171-20130828/18921_1 /TAXON_ID=374046 /ORGANISM="Helicotheca tamensis, Strain CCMP826" /LENGTH=135 /DNA_ID=CAMNT_0028402925 /DNA_START=147 /DNA_END=551 /DNA_ORIENTATION=+
MSSKLLKKLLQQANEYDAGPNEAEAAKASKTRKPKQAKKAGKKAPASMNESSGGVSDDPIQNQIKSMLQFDQVVARYSRYEDNVMKKRLRDEQREAKSRKRLRLQCDGGVGNSRSSSSRNAQLASEPTFNKKRAA